MKGMRLCPYVDTNRSFVVGQHFFANDPFVLNLHVYFYSPIVENRLKELRKDLKLTQTQLAELCETSLQMVQYLENGQRQMTQKWLERFSEVLKVPVWQILVDPKVILDEFDRELASHYKAAPEHVQKTIKDLLGIK